MPATLLMLQWDETPGVLFHGSRHHSCKAWLGLSTDGVRAGFETPHKGKSKGWLCAGGSACREL